MRKNYKYYLIYLLIFLISASLSAAVRFAYGIDIIKGYNYAVTALSDGKMSFLGCVLFTAELLQPILCLFLSAFTIYACAVGVGVTLFGGIRFGILTMSYCLSELNPFTHAVSLVLLLLEAGLLVYFSTSAAIYRSTLISTAPEPARIIRKSETLPFFYSFLAVSAVTLTLSAALYFFIIYFPL